MRAPAPQAGRAAVGVVGFDRGFEQEPNHDEAVAYVAEHDLVLDWERGRLEVGPDSRQRPSLMHSPASACRRLRPTSCQR